MNYDTNDTTRDVIDALALEPFITGAQPYARSARLERVRSDAPLRPAHGQVLRTMSEHDGRRSMLAGGDGWTLRAVRWHGGTAQVEVTAVSEELAKSVLEEATRDASEATPAEDEHVQMGFWYLTALSGGLRNERSISAEPWDRIRQNYSSTVIKALDRVMGLTAAAIKGRLILLHGPPGTGKTTALRSLAREWSSWCQVDCVLDPERLFAEPGYLMEVAVGEDDEGEEKRRWRLLILEDCDELIRGEAKHATGQALSRLLNLTDGLLGQGRDVLVAITSNEELSQLHPAVIRPGRCLAQLEIGALPYDEAAAWLGDSAGLNPDGATLAELLALRNGEEQITARRPTSPTGFYL
ncbi:MAG: ATPase central domain protein [Streptosporangiaceae bacterium]|jgi:hypothetical protein|nr:ATPase central domain protein [Streptosporangiaceae bacterium]